jgi:phthiocerol/phenolphthiocerol synthesis type-I polyketide synthase C
VLILQADVAQPSQLQAALEQVRTELPPLRGIIHAAGVLYDATLEQLTHEAFRAALAPKVDGALNLHRLTATDPLDLFVLFSSAVALLGLAGQANYAAANAFLDALAYERRSAGRPALSINWGPWAEIGLAALQANRGSRLAVQGLGSLLPHEGLAALEVLLRQELTQAAVLRFDAQAWVANSLDGAVPSILTDLLEVNPQERPSMQSLREALLAIEPGRRRQSLLEDAICAQIAQVLRIAPERIERQRPLKVMGLDSLMALELRNRLEAVTGLTLSATLAWNYPTIAILAGHLADRMGVPLSEPAQVAEPVAVVEISNALDDLDLLSDDTVEALLDDELAAIERLLKAE